PYRRHGIESVVFGNPHFQTQAYVPANRMQLVDDFESWFLRPPVDSGNAAQLFKRKILLQRPAHFDNALRIDKQADFAESELTFDNGSREAFIQRADNRMLCQCLREHAYAPVLFRLRLLS